MTSTFPTVFKAKSFRLNKSHQYADQLWTKTISTIATSSTTGQTDSVRAAYLPDGDMALPTVFGTLSWTAPTANVDAECNIKVFDSSLSAMVTAASFMPTQATFSGWVSAAQGFVIDNTWRISIDPLSSSLRFEKFNPSTSSYETKQMVTSD